MSSRKIDYLTEDDPIPNQKWVCVSFLSPEGIRNCSIRGLKIRGVYDTKQEADERASYLHKVDADFHVFVGELGKWLPWDPEPDSINDQVYAEDELQKLMKGYKEHRKKAKMMHQERTSEMREKNISDLRWSKIFYMKIVKI